MARSLLSVEARFNGPPGCANGGYIAGLIAQHSAQPVRVRLEQPVPLDTPLELEAVAGDALELHAAGRVIARATPASLELRVPPAVSYLEALEASRAYVGFVRHAFPLCFVCGTDRRRGDGLRIYAGRVVHGQHVAAPWLPDASLDDGTGKVRAEFISAALDCPGYFAACDSGVPMLLGEFIAHVDRSVHVEEPCVILGWQLAASGRKHEVGTALFDEDGELCARARAIWIEPRSAAAAPPASSG